MRISKIDLQCEDIMWFAVDSQKHIVECTSAGCGNVPEFVCRSKEDTDYLMDYFLYQLEEYTQCDLLIDYNDTNQLIKDCILLSRKGIYCFDACNDGEYVNYYTKISQPQKPLLYDELPELVKEKLIDNIIDINVLKESILNVENAY